MSTTDISTVMAPTLRTERLVLRPFTLDDAPHFAQLNITDDVCRMTGTMLAPNAALSADFHILRYASLRRRGLAWQYAVTLDGALIGGVGIFTDGEGRHEVGYWFGEPYWGRGFGGEAVRALVDEHARSFPGRELHGKVFIDNPASVRVLEKLGFVRVVAEAGHCMHRQAVIDGVRLRKAG